MRGAIVLWSGAVVDIPDGWVFCDGNNGTPDLRDKFIVGAGSTYAVGATGGTTTHGHAFTSNTHQHTLPIGPAVGAGAGFSSTSDLVAVTGTTDYKNHLPPYYALAWIMKT